MPNEFKYDLKIIHRAIDEERWNDVDRLIQTAYSRWGSDPDIIRADTYSKFERESMPDGDGYYWCEKHGHEQTVPCPDCKKGTS